MSGEEEIEAQRPQRALDKIMAAVLLGGGGDVEIIPMAEDGFKAHVLSEGWVIAFRVESER